MRGGGVLPGVIPGDAVGRVSTVPAGDVGGIVVAPGMAVVTAGVLVRSGVGVAAGAPDDDEVPVNPKTAWASPALRSPGR